MTTPHERRPGAADVDVRQLPIPSHTGPGAWHSVGTVPHNDALTITWEFSGDKNPGVLHPGAENTERRSVLLCVDSSHNWDPQGFEQQEPDAFRLTSFNGVEAGEARVFAGSIFGKSSPIDFGAEILGAELRIRPHEEFVFVIDQGYSHALLNITGNLFLEDIALEPETMGFVKEGTTTLHVINAGDDEAVAILLGGGAH
ncbi:hypothetical protein QYQ98_05750 [Corynebacterium sp. P3-F1]|uniref:hypothetical protein n=1 Tax=Corynebacterium sp. P3-F1 TaxID=3059080 RepID=UPI00265D2FDF|nr:hypothetical protein [Corynebacterium sp. P3-F1]WKK60572.1 hypothetical protein QYQ98_05750 [Corynebacterium sp. P3-F1]